MDDKELIAHHGGPAKLAEKLGYEKEGGVQRVQNWISRGIPPSVKLERPELFLLDFVPISAAPASDRRHNKQTPEALRETAPVVMRVAPPIVEKVKASQ